MDLTTYALLNKKIKKLETTVIKKNINSGSLILDSSKVQTCDMVTGTTIVLPTVNTFTEIRLIFTCTSDLTITFPIIKYQSPVESKSGKTYEYCFTWVNATIGWLGGFVSYA